MRSINYSVTLLLISISLLSSCRIHHNQSMNIQIDESDASYKFYASFPEDLTSKVHRVVNKSISPNGLFASANDYMNINTTLQDQTKFAVKASPGFIEIKINKRDNSEASYYRIKEMCAKIKRSLKD